MTREEIIDRNPLIPFLESRGIILRGQGAERQTNRCASTEHKPGHFCVNVNVEKGVWRCHDCETGGSVIDWMSLEKGVPVAELLKNGNSNPVRTTVAGPIKTPPAPMSRNGDGKPRVVKTYNYTNEEGKLLFCVCRFEPKDFRQKAPDGKGGWLYKLDGVRRVPYNLPKVIAADFVFICEGEKDADTLNAMGFVATTNCGGAKKWEPSYNAFFRGKEIAILPDNDKAGAEHLEVLRAALAPVVKSMRIVQMPEGVKDVSDFAATFSSTKDAGLELLTLTEKAEVLYRGESVPVQTMEELEQEYREHVKKAATHQLSLSPWIPSLGQCVRPLVPGEMVSILAGTGCGKTMLLQNLALNTTLATLLFEAELPGTLTFERFAAMATKRSGGNVASLYASNSSVDWKSGNRLSHITCCHLAGIKPQKIKQVIETASLKTTVRPVLVLIDYIQILGGDGDSRYERTSDAAEQLKVIAKETSTIIVVASQIGRSAGKEKEAREVSLTDGKDSGSIENSSGLVIGAWRDGSDADRLWLKVLKNTKGVSGKTIPCRIAESLLIHEEAQTVEPEARNYHR